MRRIERGTEGAWPRSMRPLPFSATALALVVGPALVRADEAPPRAAEDATHRPAAVALEGSAGFGTPLGYLGASLVVAPISVLAVHGGAGVGQQGPQIAAGLRARVRVARRTYFSPDLSWSTGSYAAAQLGERNARFYWDRAHFVNASAAVEVFAHAVSVRPFAGLGAALNHPSASLLPLCPPRGCSTSFGDRLVVFVGLGLGFDLF